MNASERPDGEERDQTIGHAAEDDEQRAGERREEDDAGRVDEAAPRVRERLGQEPVERERAAEAGEVGEARVGGEAEHGHHAADRDVVERAPPGTAPSSCESTLWYPARSGSVAPIP